MEHIKFVASQALSIHSVIMFERHKLRIANTTDQSIPAI
jgi:hypothetical protein